MPTSRAIAMYAVRNASRYSGEILEVSASVIHSNGSYRYRVINRVVCVENGFGEGNESYARVMWEVDTSEKDMKRDVTVTIVGVARDEKESRVSWGKHELRSKA